MTGNTCIALCTCRAIFCRAPPLLQISRTLCPNAKTQWRRIIPAQNGLQITAMIQPRVLCVRVRGSNSWLLISDARCVQLSSSVGPRKHREATEMYLVGQQCRRVQKWQNYSLCKKHFAPQVFDPDLLINILVLTNKLSIFLRILLCFLWTTVVYYHILLRFYYVLLYYANIKWLLIEKNN